MTSHPVGMAQLNLPTAFPLQAGLADVTVRTPVQWKLHLVAGAIVAGVFLLLGHRSIAADTNSPASLLSLLGQVTNAPLHRYQARDDAGHTLDCLQIVEVAPADYLGVYHTLKKGAFQLHLGHSTNLLDWSHRTVLDEASSQGALWRGPKGDFLLAYEVNVPDAVVMRLRHYPDRTALAQARFDRTLDLPRTLAPTAEGTPSFETVELGDDLTTSRIDLRLHYYRNRRVDRAASGTLRGFTNWTARAEPAIDAALARHGVRGNIGDRSRFRFQNHDYLLQEGQLRPGDWTGWRIYLLEPAIIPLVAHELVISTHGGSRSFANPSIARLRDPSGRWCFVVTLFIPGQGSAQGEAGSLIYAVPEP